MRFSRIGAFWCTAWLPLVVLAVEPPATDTEPLPEPLSLTQALMLSSKDHPTIAAGQADMMAGEAEVRSAVAGDDLSINLNGRLRYFEPNENARLQQHDDNMLGLLVRKPLLDFGRTTARHNAAEARARVSRAKFIDTQQRYYLQIMEDFFNVLLADLTYARDNEQVAYVFTLYQWAQDKREVGSISDVDLLTAENAYREAGVVRNRSLAARRASRARLAMSLNRPGQLSTDLLEPELVGNKRSLPDEHELEARALSDNPRLKAAAMGIEAAKARVEEATAEGRPIVFGEVETAAYSRQLEANDPFRVGINIQVPLFDGDRVDAKVAKQRAEVYAAEADRNRLQFEIRQEVLDTWLELEALYSQREEASLRNSYRELELDRNLAQFQLELRSSLGDALVASAAAKLYEAETEYRIALTWARLEALIGEEPSVIIANALGGAQ